MSSSCEPRPCALHVLVPVGEVDRPDPVGLVTTLGDRVTDLTVRPEADADGEVTLATLARAAAVMDDLSARTGRAARYEEQRGDIVDALRRDVERGVRPVVVLAVGTPRRAVRAARRAAERAAAHVAVVPTAAPSSMDCGAPR